MRATNVMTRSGLVLVLEVWGIGGPPAVCAAQSPAAVQQSIADVDRPPTSLVDVGDSARAVFDAARLSRWSVADVAMRTLRASGATLPTAWSSSELGSRLLTRLADVEASVSARQRVETMDFANGITQLVAELSTAYQMPFPYALVLLDYYGRELQLGIAAGDRARLTRATADLQQTWNRFEQAVLQKGAVDEARRVTDSVADLLDARVPADFVAPTRAALTAVDGLKKVFTP